MSNIVMNQGGQPRMSQALINVVMPGSSMTSGPRPGCGPQQQPAMHIMGQAAFNSTTSVSINLLRKSNLKWIIKSCKIIQNDLKLVGI